MTTSKFSNTHILPGLTKDLSAFLKILNYLVYSVTVSDLKTNVTMGKPVLNLFQFGL